MHELGICDAVLKMLRNIAAEEQIDSADIESITVEVGTLSGVVPRFMTDCWEAVIDGTEFEHTVMNVEAVDGQAQCLDCGEKFVADLDKLICPACGGNKLTPISGTELTLKDVFVSSF